MLGISKISHTFERYLRPQEISWPAEDILACGRRYLLEKISSTVEDIFDGRRYLRWSKISLWEDILAAVKISPEFEDNLSQGR